MATEKKIWTFGQMYQKVLSDTDFEEDDPDETLVTRDEAVGYFNEGIAEAESEIMLLNQEYFLAYDYVPLAQGVSEYDLPTNIFANKFRAIIYQNATLRYQLRKFREFNKFAEISYAEFDNAAVEYNYYLVNQSPGNVKMVLIPPSRETAVMPPLASSFTPMKRWYIRHANRIPLLGDYTNAETLLPTAVNAGTDILTVSPSVAYVTGDQLKFSMLSGSSLPSPLVAGTVYYAIAVSPTTIKLATTKANAIAGTAINITTSGVGYFSMQVATTNAIMNATLIDIPEMSTFIMEWVKANYFFKDGDPRLGACVAKLESQRQMLQTILAQAEPDNDDLIPQDLTAYTSTDFGRNY